MSLGRALTALCRQRVRDEPAKRHSEDKARRKTNTALAPSKKNMQFRFYTIPVAGDKTVEDELNAFVHTMDIPCNL